MPLLFKDINNYQYKIYSGTSTLYQNPETNTESVKNSNLTLVYL